MEVAATGPRSPLVPGLSGCQGPGEYLRVAGARPAAGHHPGRTCSATRFPGTQVGVLGRRGAHRRPSRLLVVVGRSPGRVAGASSAPCRCAVIETAPKQHDYTDFMRIALGIGAIGLMLPVLVFVMTSTRLAAARREERLAALRLVGATPRPGERRSPPSKRCSPP